VTLLETLSMEAGEKGEVVLCPDHDVPDPLVTLEGSDDFAVEDVLLGNLPAPSVEVTAARRGEWSARIRGVLLGPESPLKVLVLNTGAGKITLRATIAEES
jgi:hypothetical protein